MVDVVNDKVMWFKCNLVIANIIDRNTEKPSEKWRSDVGKECFVYAAKVNIGEPLNVYYNDGRHLKTSNIVDILEDSYGFWIITLNSMYRFDYKNN